MAVRSPTPQQKPFSLEFLGAMAIVTALLIFMYASTFQPATIDLLTAGVLLLVIGTTFGVLLVGVQFKPFSFERLFETILWTALAVGIMYIVNRQVPFTVGIDVLNARWYSVLMGVAEECFFRLFLTGFIYRISHSKFLAIVMGSSVWTTYHMARYGGDAGALLVVLLCGFALGWVFLESKIADAVIFAHGFINFLATGGKIPLVQGSVVAGSLTGGQLQAGFLPEIHDWAGLGLWALIVTIGVITVAGIINHLTHRSYQRKPSGKKPKASKNRLPSGSPKTHRKLHGPPKKRKKLKGKR